MSTRLRSLLRTRNSEPSFGLYNPRPPGAHSVKNVELERAIGF
jgi:hypothetical protein